MLRTVRFNATILGYRLREPTTQRGRDMIKCHSVCIIVWKGGEGQGCTGYQQQSHAPFPLIPSPASLMHLHMIIIQVNPGWIETYVSNIRCQRLRDGSPESSPSKQLHIKLMCARRPNTQFPHRTLVQKALRERLLASRGRLIWFNAAPLDGSLETDAPTASPPFWNLLQRL